MLAAYATLLCIVGTPFEFAFRCFGAMLAAYATFLSVVGTILEFAFRCFGAMLAAEISALIFITPSSLVSAAIHSALEWDTSMTAAEFRSYN